MQNFNHFEPRSTVQTLIYRVFSKVCGWNSWIMNVKISRGPCILDLQTVSLSCGQSDHR